MTSIQNVWHWLIYSPGGQAARISAGLATLSLLAVIDLYRRGAAATRWREYGFLLCTVAVAMLYGVLNDQITSRISWEYFYYGKGLDAVLGLPIPPDSQRLSWEAAKVGMKATWAVGLLVGVVCLLANNPRAGRASLPYAKLIPQATGVIFIFAILVAAALGIAGYHGDLAWLSEDFRLMVRRNEFRPFRFMAVYGIHLGGYIGGVIGAVIAVISIRVARRPLKGSPP